MAESNLNMAYRELQAEVGFYLGFGRGSSPPLYTETAWTTDQSGRIDSAIKSGLRQFYYPRPQPGHPASYDWSFLRPVAALTLPNAAQNVLMPDDFGGIEGRITYTSSQATMTWPIDVVNPGRIRELYAALPNMTGRPLQAALEVVKKVGDIRSEREQLLIFPQSDAAYTLNFAYYVNPNFLSGNLPYAYGGPEHAETLKASCLAAAELFQDDARGPMWENFLEQLQASMALDRRKKPQKVGYNRDYSDIMTWEDRPDQHGYSPVTVNGVQYALLLGFMCLLMAGAA